MTVDDYAKKLIDKNKRYSWIKNGEFIASQNSDDLIKLRQKYFFE